MYRSVYVHHSTSEERIWHLPANLGLKELEGVEISAIKMTMAEDAGSGKLYSTISHKILKIEVYMSSEGQCVCTVQTKNMTREQGFSGGELAGHQVTRKCVSQNTLHLSDGLPVLKQCS